MELNTILVILAASLFVAVFDSLRRRYTRLALATGAPPEAPGAEAPAAEADPSPAGVERSIVAAPLRKAESVSQAARVVSSPCLSNPTLTFATLAPLPMPQAISPGRSHAAPLFRDFSYTYEPSTICRQLLVLPE